MALPQRRPTGTNIDRCHQQSITISGTDRYRTGFVEPMANLPRDEPKFMARDANPSSDLPPARQHSEFPRRPPWNSPPPPHTWAPVSSPSEPQQRQRKIRTLHNTRHVPRATHKNSAVARVGRLGMCEVSRGVTEIIRRKIGVDNQRAF